MIPPGLLFQLQISVPLWDRTVWLSYVNLKIDRKLLNVKRAIYFLLCSQQANQKINQAA